MEPVSIAAATLSASKSLYSTIADLTAFIKATKQVDHAIQSLEALGRGLAGVLVNLADALKQPVLNNTANAHLFSSVNDAVESCQDAVQELETALKPIKGAGSSLVRRAWRAHQLGLQRSEIDRLTAAMRTHSINLQLALQTVNVIITASIPGAISAAQSERFDRLEHMLNTLYQDLEGNDHAKIKESTLLGIEGGGEETFTIQLDRNTKKLFATAASIITSPASRASRAAPSEAFTDRRQSAFEIFSPMEIYNPSEFGSPLGNAQVNSITKWIDNAPTVAPSETDGNSSAPTLPEDDEEEDELEFLIAQSLIRKGTKLFEAGQVGSAREHLARGLARTANLSTEKAQQLQLIDIRFTYALSCYDQGDFHEAESNFHSVIEASASAENRAVYYCKAMQGLAALELRARKLDIAITHSRQAIRATSRTLGAYHPVYFDCVRTLSLSFWAKGDGIEARAYSDILPENERIAERDYDILLASTYKPYEQVETTKTPPAGGQPSRAPVEQDTASNDANSLIDSINSSMTIAPSTSEASSSRQTLNSANLTSITSETSVRSSYPTEVARAIETVKTLRSNGPNSVDDTSLTTTTRVIKTHRWYESSKAGQGLYFAAEYNRPIILEALLQIQDADINCRRSGTFSMHCTPLTAAAGKGNYDICELLLSHGADPTLSFRNQTPLSEAITGKQYDIVCLLINHRRALIDALPRNLIGDLLIMVVTKGNMELCALLLQLYKTSWRFGHLNNVLPIAARQKNKDMCELLLKAGANIEGPVGMNYVRRSALMEAASNNDVALAQLLLQRGAKVDGKTPTAATPLVCAAMANAYETCRLLLQAGASKDQSTTEGTALERACSQEVRLLLAEWP